MDTGTILLYPVPGSRLTDDDGASRPVPAVVLDRYSDGAVKLFVLHFEGQFQAVISAHAAAELEVLYRPKESERLDRLTLVVKEMRKQIESLQKTVAQLTVAPKPARELKDTPEFPKNKVSTAGKTE